MFTSGIWRESGGGTVERNFGPRTWTTLLFELISPSSCAAVPRRIFAALVAPTHSEHNRFSFIGGEVTRRAHYTELDHILEPYRPLSSRFVSRICKEDVWILSPHLRMRCPMHTIIPFALADVSGCPLLYSIDDLVPAGIRANRFSRMLTCHSEWLGAVALSYNYCHRQTALRRPNKDSLVCPTTGN